MRLISELKRQAPYDCIRAVDIGLLRLPLGEGQPLTGIVEAENWKKKPRVRKYLKGEIVRLVPILTSRDTVEIDDNFEIVFLCPSDSLKEVVMLTRDVWFTGTNVIRPIPDRDPHVIEAKKSTTLRPQ